MCFGTESPITRYASSEPAVAIGHEPPLERWLPLKYPSLLPCLKTRLAWSPPDDEGYRNGRQRRSKPLAQIERDSYSELGWISRQNLLALRSRENFFQGRSTQKTKAPATLPSRGTLRVASILTERIPYAIVRCPHHHLHARRTQVRADRSNC